jgi:hypothetical protein
MFVLEFMYDTRSSGPDRLMKRTKKTYLCINSSLLSIVLHDCAYLNQIGRNQIQLFGNVI